MTACTGMFVPPTCNTFLRPHTMFNKHHDSGAFGLMWRKPLSPC